MLLKKNNLKFITFTAIILLFSTVLGVCFTTESSKNEPFVIIADDFAYHEKVNIITATGHVYVSHNNQLLYADSLQYNKETDTLHAKGNVWLRDKEGNFSFGDYVELKNKFNDGFVRNAKLLMADNSRIAGAKGQRFKGQKIVLWNGVYSPCEVCKKQPDSAPLWQLRANKIIHDKEEKEIVYHNAFMDFWGVPILYTPYFFHPDSTVKRKTGLLRPFFGQSNDLGTIISQPFYLNISPNSDLTLHPIYTTKEGPLIAADYRHLYSAAVMRLNVSYAGDSHNNNAKANNPNAYKLPGKHRWHAFLDARVELDPDHLLTTSIRRASDLTYLRRYPISTGNVKRLEIQTSLTSTIALEQFKNTSYGIVRGYIFQTDNQKYTPYIYPVANYTYETMPGDFGETFGFDFNFLNLSRENSLDGQYAKQETRGSLDLNAQVPYVSSWGDIWQLKAKLRTDAYSIHEYQPPKFIPNPLKLMNSRYEYKRIYRVFPQSALNWRYPFMKIFDNGQWILEPAASLIIGSQGQNSVDIPNEDSPFVTLDPMNLYLMNRFTGIDRIDTGRRAVYGVHSRFLWDYRYLFLFLGQTKRLDNKTALLLSSGENNTGSGIVGKIEVKPFKFMTLQSRFLLNRNQLKFDIAESSVGLNFGYGNATASHVYYDSKYSTDGNKTSQFNWTIRTASYKNVTLGFGEVRNLGAPSGSTQLLSRTFTLTHANECLITNLSVSRSGYTDRDLKPNTIVMVQLIFKNLGMITPVNFNGLEGSSIF